LARPKSMMNSLLQWRPIPIRKLSGLMSRWMKFFTCLNGSVILLFYGERERSRVTYIYSMRPIIWSASINT
jgi:hypothetical protein